MNAVVLNAVGFLALLVVINLPAGFIGLEFDDDPIPGAPLTPPGWLVVAAWFILLPLMGYARWQLQQLGEPGGLIGNAVIALAVLCAAYAYYTIGLARLTGIDALWFGLIGNVVVILFAAFVAYAAWPLSLPAGIAIALVAVWTAFASISVVGGLIIRYGSPAS